METERNPNPNSNSKPNLIPIPIPNRQREPSPLVGGRGFFWDLNGRKPSGKVVWGVWKSFGDRPPKVCSAYYSVWDDDQEDKDDDHEDVVAGIDIIKYGLLIFRYLPKEKFEIILFDLLEFISSIPPPATIVVVSGNAEFAPFLRKVKGKGYHTIVISCSKDASSAFRDAGLIIYDWGPVINGKGYFPLEEEEGPSLSKKRDYASFSKEEA